MANLNRLAVCLRAGSLRRYSLQVGILFISMFCGPSALVQAAQVTFAFEATVTDIADPNGLAASLPFVPAIGQPVIGSVTFTPVPFGQTSDNDAKLEIAWEGETFTASSQKLTTINDYPVSPGFPFDGLSVDCGVPDGCATSSSGISIREFALVLRSFQDVIPAGQLMDSVDAWNQFEDRQILLFLTNLTDTTRISVFASVGPMHGIPEPPSVVVLLSLGLISARTHRLRRK